MSTVKENKEHKVVAFTKKKTYKPSFQAKIEKANKLLDRTVFIKKDTAVSH